MCRLIPCAAAILLAVVPAFGAVWPAQWQDKQLVTSEPLTVADRELWSEFQGDAAETAIYRGPRGTIRATAWRLSDMTSAFAWYLQVRPSNCVPIGESASSCNSGGGQYLQKIPSPTPGGEPVMVTGTAPSAQYIVVKNYVLALEGARPAAKDIEALEAALPKTRAGGGMPKLPSLLPEKNRLRNSERYIMGVQSLAKYEPRIPAILMGFEDGAEAQVARYKTPAGEVAMTLVHYASPQLARKYQPGFEQQPGFVVKRSGTMIAVIPGGHNAETLAGILKPVEWRVTFVWNEATKALPMPDVAGMLISIFQLTGLLLLICVGGGLAFAAFWIILRRRQAKMGTADSSFIALHISE